MTMSRDEARVLISSLIEWYTEDIAERLGLSMGKETYMDALDALWHGPDGDLISRADAIDAVWYEIDHGYTAIVDRIKALPSAEAVQGEWVKTSDGNGWNEWYVLKCPICGATIEDKHYHSWKYNFCPNCGAKMKDGDNNEID